jgi:hypothetical protein
MPLSFFTNSGNSYGSALPFQRIVEPSQLGFFLDLEQAELLRIQRYNEGWRFYFGKHWMFKREDGEPLVTINLFRKILDKSVAFLVAKGFAVQTPEVLEEVTKPFINEVWTYNKGDQFAWDAATMGACTGDVFVLVTYEEPTPMQQRINPFSQGRIRINLLGSEQVYPTWDPLNTDTLTAVRIETIYYAERGTRQLDRDDRVNHEGRQLYTKRFTQIITPTQILEQFHGEQPLVRPNVLGEIPLVHIKNLSLPKEYYGLSDGFDIIDLQRELNEKATDISDTINYHSAPVTVITGAKASQLTREARQIWSGLPKDANVFNLRLEGDLTAAQNYMKFIKTSLHELSDVPENALGATQPISNTSGVALHLQYQPLIEKTRKKKAQYEPGFEQINYFILRIGMAKGLINLPFDLCKHCGGRIIEIETNETAKVWNPNASAYEDRPIRKKKCYHIDKSNFEFVKPEEMRLKFWRKYGFGQEIRELPLSQIEKELRGGFESFWDYAAAQEKKLQSWVDANKAQFMPQPQAPGAEGEAAPEAPPMQIPADIARMLSPQPPKAITPGIIPLHEIDIPEEPERVTVTLPYVNPDTQEYLFSDTKELFLVPTGCKRPAYLNPFENAVEFQETLPKDEALQAQLYQQYQQAGWVDEEWVRERIPEIAPDASEIRRRLKAKPQAAPVAKDGTSHQELAPPHTPLATVPGPRGNPISADKQLDNMK